MPKRTEKWLQRAPEGHQDETCGSPRRVPGAARLWDTFWGGPGRRKGTLLDSFWSSFWTPFQGLVLDSFLIDFRAFQKRIRRVDLVSMGTESVLPFLVLASPFTRAPLAAVSSLSFTPSSRHGPARCGPGGRSLRTAAGSGGGGSGGDFRVPHPDSNVASEALSQR